MKLKFIHNLFFSIKILTGVLILIPHTAFGYIKITNLSERDPQYQLLQKSKSKEQIKIYEYKIKKGENFLSIAKKANISISALISLNRSNHISQYKPNDYILLPSKKGVFISINPSTDLEYLLHERLLSRLRKELPFLVNAEYSNFSNFVYFMADAVLTKSEYRLWTIENFRSPVLHGQISSYFGMRTSPITGENIHHDGVDIASKLGSQIFASISGKVISDGYHKIYGYYLVIEHTNNYRTLYGHLLDAKVKVGDSVFIGQHIGYMGNTGASTGSHIHFEIHKNHLPVDPLTLLNFN